MKQNGSVTRVVLKIPRKQFEADYDIDGQFQLQRLLECSWATSKYFKIFDNVRLVSTDHSVIMKDENSDYSFVTLEVEE